MLQEFCALRKSDNLKATGSYQDPRVDKGAGGEGGDGQARTHGKRNDPVDELAGETAVAVHDVALKEVLRGALPEGRDAYRP